jgi:predicted esterase YcpF (UPF0227 family)
MKRILYLHGFASSGASGTVELLRREFWERAEERMQNTAHLFDKIGLPEYQAIELFVKLC